MARLLPAATRPWILDSFLPAPGGRIGCDRPPTEDRGAATGEPVQGVRMTEQSWTPLFRRAAATVTKVLRSPAFLESRSQPFAMMASNRITSSSHFLAFSASVAASAQATSLDRHSARAIR